MTSRHHGWSLGVFLLIVGCSSEEGGDDPNRRPALGDAGEGAACTPESLCVGCGGCFESCRCGGGTAARCSEECSEIAPPSDGAGGSDAGSGPRAPLAETLAIEAFEIPAGEEFFRCQNFENPFGRDVAVLKSESFMTAGGHHMFVFNQAGLREGALEPCGGLEFGPNIHGSQKSQDLFEYPEGVGRFLGAGEGLRIQVHYLNPSQEARKVEVAVTLHAAPAEEVPVLASQVFINTLGINIPPRSPGTVETSCRVPKDVELLVAASHMHRHGTYFTARDGEGQLIYETNEWEEPEPWRFDPTRKLKAGTWIHLKCEYQNDTDQPLTFGESALNNEMCILSGAYFPAAPGEAITCLF